MSATVDVLHIPGASGAIVAHLDGSVKEVRRKLRFYMLGIWQLLLSSPLSNEFLLVPLQSHGAWSGSEGEVVKIAMQMLEVRPSVCMAAQLLHATSSVRNHSWHQVVNYLRPTVVPVALPCRMLVRWLVYITHLIRWAVVKPRLGLSVFLRPSPTVVCPTLSRWIATAYTL